MLPATATIDDVRGGATPDGVFFSNGPGDPATARREVALLRAGARRAASRSSASASATSCSAGRSGFGTYKLKYGHRGINQPVMDRTTGKVEVTAHNHGFAVDAPLDREQPTRPTARRTGQRTCASTTTSSRGSSASTLPAYSVQYHPEAAAGPHDAAYLFDRFVDLMSTRPSPIRRRGSVGA